jgi:homoserine dehydrogenase
LCEEGKELFEYAEENNRAIRFEASVGGGIPIIKSLKESFAANDIQAIYGIVNGTSNYILRSMQVDGFEFNKALSDAKRRGFAERNATLDVNGTDSAHKLALLTLLGFGKVVSLKDIYVEGITDIQPYDIEFAKDLGYCIKLLAIAKKIKDEIELRVHPTLVEEDHPLSSVRGVNNAIYVKGDLIGESLFYGKGAGMYPTSSAVVSDMIDLAKGAGRNAQTSSGVVRFSSGIKKIKPMEKIKSRYYVRFSAIDRPGVLASISSILAKEKISIASVKQIERRSQRVVPIIMLTHEALEKSMARALKSINAQSCIKAKSVAIRIENL